ncbi:hypothetical protein ACYATP_05220 [Lactobacillaceae bacterium Melli_B4]
MDKRTWLLTKFNFKQDLRVLLITFVATFMAALVIPSLFSFKLKFDYAFFTGIYAWCIVFLPLVSFDDQFRQGIQNSFSRAQIFNSKLMTTLPWVFLLTVLTLISNGDNGGNWGHYFQNSVLNVTLVVLLQVVINISTVWGVQFLGAFFALFSKKMRKYVVMLIFALMIFFIIGLIWGGTMLVEYQVVDSKFLLTMAKVFSEVVLGYNGSNSDYNPVNPIISCIIFSIVMMYATSFITLRLQIHRES